MEIIFEKRNECLISSIEENIELDESLSSPVNVTYSRGSVPKDGNEIFGKFRVGSLDYRIILIPYGVHYEKTTQLFQYGPPEKVDTLEVHFQVKGEDGEWTHEITDSESAFSVFATIANETLKFSQKYKCDTVTTSINDGNKKRISLYSRIMRKLGAQEGYSLSVNTSNDMTTFTLSR